MSRKLLRVQECVSEGNENLSEGEARRVAWIPRGPPSWEHGYETGMAHGSALCIPTRPTQSHQRRMTGRIPPPVYSGQCNPAAQHLAEPITMEEVQVALTACRRDTSPGMDGIPNALLRHLPEEGIRRLTEVYNNIFDTGMVPLALED